MSDQSGSSSLGMLFEAALQDYEKMTGIALTKHPLAEQLQHCNSMESVIVVLQDQAQDFKKFREKDKVLKPLKKVLTVLHLLSSAPGIVQHVGLVRLKALIDLQRL
jgi:STAND-like protein